MKTDDEWEKWLDHPDVTVIMDNDGWWFKWVDGKEPEDFDEENAWWGDGQGPYGLDLLQYILEHKYDKKMEWV